MQRAPANGGQVGLTAAVDPSSPERLEHVATMLRQERPWPAFLLVGARATEEWEACPAPVQEALAWIVTNAAGLLDIASVVPLLEPVCQAFKALIEAAQGAAASQEKLQSLVSRCAFLTTVFIQHGRAVGPLAQVRKPMEDFVATTNKVAAFAAKWANGGKCRAFFCHRTDKSTLSDFEEDLRKISDDIILVDGLEHHQLLLALDHRLRPPSLPDLAAVPLGAIELTDTHISRASLLGSAVGYLANTVVGDAPCVLAGMAGGGKSFLASAVVRDEQVRERFRAGMFWWRVGRDAKDQLHGWLKGFALQVVSASGISPPRLDSLEDVTRYLKAECAKAQRLVVLDDVWEREVVDALKLAGLQLLVTTRDRSVVSAPGEVVEVGDMEEDEALELLRVGCGALKTVELPRPEALQVVYDCGKLPLLLGLAAPLLKGPPQDPMSWRTLHEALYKAMTSRIGTNRVMRVPARVDAVLEVSLGAMADDPAQQKRCLFLAVLAPGTLARSDMLQDLWDEAPGASKTFAAHLVDQSMLQPVGDDFRVHDLVLHFLKLKLKADPSRYTATGRTVEHLGQLKVLERYLRSGETSDGAYSLMALWRSVENLTEESHVAAVYTKNLHGVPDSVPWSQAGRLLELMGKFEDADPLFVRVLEILSTTVGEEHPGYASALNNRAGLLEKQGKHDEAGPLYERSQAIRETVLGPEHPDVAGSLNNRAALLKKQGIVARLLGLEAAVEVASGAPPRGCLGPDLATEAIRQLWLPSCGDINRVVSTTPPTDGAPLSLHSVSRRALRPAGDGSTRILHLPPGSMSGHGVVCQRWRDKYGQVEIKAAPQGRKHVEEVRLLDDVFMIQVSRRQESNTCLITPVVQGPTGATFPLGTASISYYVGRYDLLVLTKGEKGGKEGMESYVRDTYFAVVKADGVDQQWEPDSDSTVVWKGNEIWLEVELQHFSLKGLAEKWDRFTGSRASRTPLGSNEYPEIQVVNDTDECLRVMLVPETFLTAEARARSQAAVLSLQIAGQGLSVDGSKEKSDSLSQEPTFVYSSLTWNTIPKREAIDLELPGGKRCRILWCSISDRFHPEDLPIDQNTKNPVNEDELEGHGYEIFATGSWLNKTYHFKEKARPEELHRSLLFVRVWEQSSISFSDHRRNKPRTMRPSVLAESCVWNTSVPSLNDINTNIISWLVTIVPGAGAPFR